MAPKKPLYNSALTRANNARDSILAPTGGVPEYDIMSFENPYASPEEIKERLLRKQGVSAVNEPENPNVNPEDLPSDLVAEIREKGSVRFTPEEHAEMLRTNTYSKKEKLARAFANLPAASTPTALAAVPPAAPPEASPSEVAPPEAATTTAPVQPTAPAQEDRLTQLARIISTTQTPQSPEALRRAASQDALSKIQAAMYAGLTRTPVPQSVFTPFKGATEVDRLEQLYRASQILGKPETAPAFVDPVFIDNLRRQYPEANIPADLKLTRDQYQAFSANLDRERTELGKGERFEKSQTTKKELAEIQQQTDATKFISKQSDKVKTEAEAVPYLKELAANPAIAESILSPGSTFRSKFAGGVLSTEEQQNFDRLVEGIAGPFRAGRFGLSQTSAELKNFEKLMGEADRTGNPVLRVKGLRDLIRSMRERLRNNWATARNADKDSEIYKQYKAYEEETGNTDNNEIFDTLINQLNDIIESAPEQQQTPWQKVKGAVGETVKTFTGDATTPQQTTRAPTTAPTPEQQTPEQKRQRLEELRRKKAAGAF